MSINNWIKNSNRWRHAAIGAGIALATMALGDAVGIKAWQASVMAVWVVLGCMLTAEVKDRLWGGKLDWSDVIAGMIGPLLALLLIILEFVIGEGGGS